MGKLKIICIKAATTQGGNVIKESELVSEFVIDLNPNLSIDDKGVNNIKEAILSIVSNYAMQPGETYSTEVEITD